MRKVNWIATIAILLMALLATAGPWIFGVELSFSTAQIFVAIVIIIAIFIIASAPAMSAGVFVILAAGAGAAAGASASVVTGILAVAVAVATAGSVVIAAMVMDAKEKWEGSLKWSTLRFLATAEGIGSSVYIAFTDTALFNLSVWGTSLLPLAAALSFIWFLPTGEEKPEQQSAC